MRSAQLDLGKYDSDKIDNHYLERYDPVFEPFLDKKISLLELGVKKGGSLMLWHDYFPNSTVVGIDIILPKAFEPTDDMYLFEGSQADPEFLTSVVKETSPCGFDIIIDDASHIGELTKIAFWHLFDNHLKPGGIYVLEDWGTGYWGDWSDGKSLDLDAYTQKSPSKVPAKRPFLSKVRRRVVQKSPWPNHSCGMVGFVKQLVDEQAAPDVTRKNLQGKPGRASKFESMVIATSIVFIKKAK